MKFGDNLKTIRKEKNVSQEKLAEQMNLSRQSISKWETGEAYPTMNNILELCKIFNCRINDLVHEDMSDIDSLDNEIKMEVVKFKKEEQQKMKGLSKAIYILARIAKCVALIGFIVIVTCMILVPFLMKGIKVDDNYISFYDNKVEYEIKDEQIIIEDEKVFIDFESTKYLNFVLDKVKNDKSSLAWYAELTFVVGGICIIMLYLAVKNLELLFVNIHNGDTPFTLENVGHIKKIAKYMIIIIIATTIGGGLINIITGMETMIYFDLMDVIYVLILFSIAYVFEYGYLIQKDSKGIMYDKK